MNKAPATFGSRLKEALRRTKKTQRALAKKLNKDEGAVSRWVNGTTEPMELAEVLAAADFLKTSVDWLLGRDDFAAPPGTLDRAAVTAAVKQAQALTDALRQLEAELESMED